MNIPIIKQTPDYLVINKPAGLLVHPTLAHETDTLTAWLTAHYPEIANVGDDPAIRPGIVHRLDKDTSGLMVVARTQSMFNHLKNQFLERTTQKEYYALVYGTFTEAHSIIDLPIARSHRGTMSGSRDPDDERTLREAKTEWWIDRRFTHVTLLRIKIYTGRMHQIRAHMKAIGHPVVGDPLYRARTRWKQDVPDPPRMFLHAHQLLFSDLTNQQQTFTIDLPPELQTYLARLH